MSANITSEEEEKTPKQNVINPNISNAYCDCFWCDHKIKIGDPIDILPGGRGYVHRKCAEEWYSVQIAED